jgi:hypothetical protein
MSTEHADDVRRRLNAAEYYPTEINRHSDSVEYIFAGGVHNALELQRTAWAAAGSRDRVTLIEDDRMLILAVVTEPDSR